MRAARPHRAAPRAALPRSARRREARTRQIPFHRPFQRPVLCDKLCQGRTVSEARAADPFCSMHFLEASARCLLVAVRQPGTTAGMAAGTISAGAFGEEYDIHDRHSTGGIVLCFVFAPVACLLVENSFQGLLVSQALLSLQLPIAVFLQIYLTSSSEIMGAYANSLPLKLRLLAIGIFVAVLDVLLML